MSERLLSIDRKLPQMLTLLLACFVGICAFVVATLAADVPRNKLAFLAAAVVGVPLLALASGQTKRVFLFFWIVCLTYNRNYFIDALGNNGSYGLYWNPSDVFLAGLIGLWGYEVIVRKHSLPPVGRRLWPWFLPFAVACLCSAFYAQRVDWVLFEMARVARIGLILAYVRCNVRREDWWVCLAGFGCAIVVQASHGLVFVLTGSNLGLSGLLGANVDVEGPMRFVTGSLDAVSGARRAMGTFGHPNTFACYLLLAAPVFLALTAAPMRRNLRVICGLVGVIALAGIAVTMSRTSWAITLIQCSALMIGLTALGVVKARRALGVTILGAFLGTLAIAPFTERIHNRLVSDFTGAVDFRIKHDRIALDIWRTSPFFGIGLNNYSETLSKYGDPEVDTFLALGEYARTMFEIRVTAWVHNIYLLFLAETGMLGLVTFLWFAIGTFIMGMRAIRVRETIWGIASLGLLLGMLGVYAHGLQESALWIDPVTYSFALVAGMLNNVPGIVVHGSGGSGVH